MDLEDLGFPVPGDGVQAVTPIGDVPTVVGEESLRRWILRVIATEPGTLLHRPDFGVGVESYVDQPILTAATQLANEIKRQVRRDRRVRDVKVLAGQSATEPRRLEVGVEVTTVDGSTVGVTTSIAVGV